MHGAMVLCLVVCCVLQLFHKLSDIKSISGGLPRGSLPCLRFPLGSRTEKKKNAKETERGDKREERGVGRGMRERQREERNC